MTTLRAAGDAVWSWWVQLTVEHPWQAVTIGGEVVALVVLAILVGGWRGRHRR